MYNHRIQTKWLDKIVKYIGLGNVSSNTVSPRWPDYKSKQKVSSCINSSAIKLGSSGLKPYTPDAIVEYTNRHLPKYSSPARFYIVIFQYLV